ncbi:sugar kinase [Amycolatopsis acidicola]|uniref:Sugar kinase n=1 Tax=Amycolatopsis acidicola TaxID=2596893 RepID=A0A5N0UJK9_9PSEU|nr:sugar kinase [Amycolatopsis acidicola]KAA9148665.1 sugar kinase [Amycolatopsis acidicola]
MTPEVLCIGETMVLVTPVVTEPLAEAELFRLEVGGAESTVALYMAERGHRTAWASRVGDDPLGRRILEKIAGHGVDTSWVRADPGAPTGVYFKDPAPEGTRVHYYRAGSAASRLSPDDLAALPMDASLVHLTGITPALSASCRALVEAALGRPGLVSFDVNYRPGLWPVGEAAPVLAELARRADIVLVGQDEAETLWGATTPEAVREILPGPDRLVIKDGAIGATEYHGAKVTFVPAPAVDVVEPVGAGDAFASGYLSGVLRGQAATESLALGHELAGRALGGTGDFVPLAVDSGGPVDPAAGRSYRG